MRTYLEYKDTGAEWIGDIPKGWVVSKVKYITRDHRQGYYSPAEYDDNGFRLIRITDIKDDHTVEVQSSPFYDRTEEEISNFIVRDGDFLFPRTGGVGRFGIVDFHTPSIYGSFLIRFRFNKLISRKLLKYFFDSQMYLDQVLMEIHGGVNQNVHVENIKSCNVLIPPPSEQNQISNYLDRKTLQIDDLSEKTEQKIKLLKEQRSSLINECVTKGLDPNIEMKDSGVEWIGEIPCEWGIIPLKYTTKKIGSGVTPRGGSEVYSESGIPFLRSQNIHFGGLNLENVVYISDELHKNMSGSKVQSGDVLFNITGASIGRCCFISGPQEYNVNQHVCIVRPKKELETRFLNYFFSSQIGQYQVNLNITGSGREGLNFENLGNFLLPKVPFSEQKQISDFLDRKTTNIDQIIDTEIKRVDLLREYRQSLISSVVTGKMRITEDLV
jgi:type I restriction enzyme S subunit